MIRTREVVLATAGPASAEMFSATCSRRHIYGHMDFSITAAMQGRPVASRRLRRLVLHTWVAVPKWRGAPEVNPEPHVAPCVRRH